jgi:hypothetical protein
MHVRQLVEQFAINLEQAHCRAAVPTIPTQCEGGRPPLRVLKSNFPYR